MMEQYESKMIKRYEMLKALPWAYLIIGFVPLVIFYTDHIFIAYIVCFIVLHSLVKAYINISDLKSAEFEDSIDGEDERQNRSKDSLLIKDNEIFLLFLIAIIIPMVVKLAGIIH